MFLVIQPQEKSIAIPISSEGKGDLVDMIKNSLEVDKQTDTNHWQVTDKQPRFHVVRDLKEKPTHQNIDHLASEADKQAFFSWVDSNGVKFLLSEDDKAKINGQCDKDWLDQLKDSLAKRSTQKHQSIPNSIKNQSI